VKAKRFFGANMNNNESVMLKLGHKKFESEDFLKDTTMTTSVRSLLL
jgi:hypothetical protein